MSKNALLLGRGIFLIFIIIAFGLIIVNEKKGEILKGKVEKEINNYIETNFSNLNLEKEKIEYKDNIFKQKLSHKNNKNHYFYIVYSNKEITDTYKKDYEEGNKLLNIETNKIKKEIKEKTSIECDVLPTNKLNEYNTLTQEKIINSEFDNLKYYYIKKELVIDKWEENEINNQITSLINKISSNNFTPKYYNITIIDKNDITKSIEINNLTEEYLNNPESVQIIRDILNNNNSELLKKNKITYK